MIFIKKGYTLAEILITLGVIGVIAALMIPQLVDNTKKNQYGATLGRAVQQIELGISNIIQKVNNNAEDGSIVTSIDMITVEDFTGTPPEEGTESPLLTADWSLFKHGSIYMGLEEIGTANATAYYNRTDTGFSSENVALFQFESFNAYIMYDKSKGTTNNNDIYTMIAIDVNGSAKPNKKGRDIFGFGLTTTGKLIPAGSEKVKDYTTAVSTNSLGTIANASTGCNTSEITNQWSCTALVVQDGFKINY